MTDPQLLPHVAALIERLETTDFPVGNHRNVLTGQAGHVVAPSVVLYLRAGGEQSGPSCAPEEDAWFPFRLTCIGKTPDSAMVVADHCHVALKSSPLEVDGRSIARIKRQWFGASALRDDALNPPLYYVPVEYRLWTISAPAES